MEFESEVTIVKHNNPKYTARHVKETLTGVSLDCTNNIATSEDTA